MINLTWNKSLVCVDTNKNAIVNKGWGPNNRNIITFSQNRISMHSIVWQFSSVNNITTFSMSIMTVLYQTIDAVIYFHQTIDVLYPVALI